MIDPRVSPPDAVALAAPRAPGLLFIVSAPSGAGKTSLLAALRQRDPGLRLSVSYTTRAPRCGERDGEHYHFVTRERFEQMLERGEFLESALVHGNYYGTGERWVLDQMAAGADIVLEIDWQGAAQVRRRLPASIGIFVLPPSFAALAARLRARAQDAPAVIEARLEAAREEISHVGEFDYAIINDEFDRAVDDLWAVVRAARLRTTNQSATLDCICSG
ncbi:MAG: guanylate kinase [Burkholderiales bacterium]|nr:guanylate kinase [Burkholderiales bacterium]